MFFRSGEIQAPTLGTSGAGLSDTHRFTSYERDAETGTDYAINRQYASNLGRFLQSDPLPGTANAPRSLHRYAYSLNDPVNYLDPTGLAHTDDNGNWVGDFPGEWLDSTMTEAWDPVTQTWQSAPNDVNVFADFTQWLGTQDANNVNNFLNQLAQMEQPTETTQQNTPVENSVNESHWPQFLDCVHSAASAARGALGASNGGSPHPSLGGITQIYVKQGLLGFGAGALPGSEGGPISALSWGSAGATGAEMSQMLTDTNSLDAIRNSYNYAVQSCINTFQNQGGSAPSGYFNQFFATASFYSLG